MWWMWAELAMAGPVVILPQDPGTGPSDGCTTSICRALVTLVDGATTSIDFALYGYRAQPAVLDALRAARERGVVVRGVVDSEPDGSNPYRDTATFVAEWGARSDRAVDEEAARQERARPTYRCPSLPGRAGPPQCLAVDVGDACVIGTNQAVGAMEEIGGIVHDKFFVVDRARVWTGSANLSDSCTGGYNANVVLTLDVPAIALAYEAEFEQMWGGAYHGLKARRGPTVAALPGGGSVAVYFSPQDDPMDKALRPAIQRAARRIDVGAFFLTHTGLVRDLIEAHERGVAVRVLLDATGAANEYSKHEVLRLAGIPVKIEDFGGKMHAKVAAIDDEIVVAGSMNWTGAGADDNDENTLVLRDPASALTLRRWLDALWARVPDRWLSGRPEPESRDSGTACTDGMDNDFDGLADGVDPSCGLPAPTAPDLWPLVRVPKGPDQGLVRGFVDPSRGRVYALPGTGGSALTSEPDSVWFCSEADAKAAGYAPL